jgi:MFS family permease
MTIAYILLVGVNAGYTLLNLPPVLDDLLELYHVSYAGISVLLSALLWSHAAIQVPGGLIIDRLGVRRSLFIALICIFLGNVIAAIIPSMPLAITGRVIAGFGTGLTFIVSMKLIALNAEPLKVGVYQSFFGGVFSAGSIFAFLFLPRLIVYGWRITYLSAAALGLVCLILFPWVRTKKETLGAVKRIRFKRVITIKGAWAVGAFHALSYGSIITLGNWMPSVLAELTARDAGKDFAWLGMTVLFLSGLGRIAGGFILFRFKAMNIIKVTIVTIALLYTGMFLSHNAWLTIALVVIMAWAASINFGALWQCTSHMTEPSSMATLFGFVNLLANLGTVGFTLMFGWMKDGFGSFSYGFAVLAILAALSLGVGFRTLLEEMTGYDRSRKVTPK